MTRALDRIDPRVLGERLRAARARAGLTQVETADQLRVARTTIVAIEKGDRRVRAEDLKSLSEIFGISVSALTRPSAITVELVPRFRAMPATPDGPTLAAAKLLNALAAAEVELERLLDAPLPRNYPPERPILSGDVREQAEEAALELRHRFGLGLGAVGDIVSFLELELGVRVFIRPLPSGSVSGLYAYEESVGACILLNRNHPQTRRSLTAAHELGHFLATRHKADVCDDATNVTAREERYANAFAFAFLMPSAAVRRRFQEYSQGGQSFSPRHLILMAHAFHVSPPAMCRRLEDLRILPGGTWDSLHERGFSGEHARSVLGDRSAEALGGTPPRLWFLASEAYRLGLKSEGQLADMLVMDRLEVRELLDAMGAEDAEDEPIALVR